MGGKEVPLARVQRAVWGMLYADDAGIFSKSAEGLAKMMAVIATVSEATGLTVTGNNTRQCCYEHGIRHPLPHRS